MIILIWTVLNGLIVQAPIDSVQIPKSNLYGEFGDRAILYLPNLSWGTQYLQVYTFKGYLFESYELLVVGKDGEWKKIDAHPNPEFSQFPTLIRMGGSCRVADGDVFEKKKLKPFSRDFVGELANPFE